MSSNLQEAIEFVLGQKLNFSQPVDEADKKDLEAIFVDSTENPGKTGRYLKREEEEDDENNEDVHFFNYNLDGGWWYTEYPEEEQDNSAPKHFLFNKDGKLVNDISNVSESQIHLSQFKRIDECAEYSLKTYDYTMLIVYSKISKDLVELRNKFNRKFNNLFISQAIPHSKNNLGFYRMTLLLTGFNYFQGYSDKIELSQLLKAIKDVNPILVIPCVVREEVKAYLKDFESDEDVYQKIVDFVQLHRYDFCYDSDDEASNDSEDPDTEDENEEDILEMLAKKKNKKESKQKQEGEDDEEEKEGDDDDEDDDEDNEDDEEGDDEDDDDDSNSSSDDDDDSRPKVIFVEKKVEE